MKSSYVFLNDNLVLWWINCLNRESVLWNVIWSYGNCQEEIKLPTLKCDSTCNRFGSHCRCWGKTRKITKSATVLMTWTNTSYDKVKKAMDGDNKNPDRLFSYMFRPIRDLYLLSYFVTSPGRLCCNFWFASRLAYDKIKDYSALFCFSRLFSPVGIDMEAA